MCADSASFAADSGSFHSRPAPRISSDDLDEQENLRAVTEQIRDEFGNIESLGFEEMRYSRSRPSILLLSVPDTASIPKAQQMAERLHEATGKPIIIRAPGFHLSELSLEHMDQLGWMPKPGPSEQLLQLAERLRAHKARSDD